MKKRTREILVDGRKYVWLVVEGMWPTITLRVWKAEHARTPWFELITEATDHPLTPRDVAAAIRHRCETLD